MEVYDITDSSRSVSIVSAFDVLFPDIDDRLMKRVRRRLPRQPVAKAAVDAIIADERKILAAEMAALDQAEMAKRGHIVVDGEVVAYRRHIEEGVEGGSGKKVTDFWWMPYGKYKGRGFSKIPRRYLEVLLPHVRDQGLARNIRKFLAPKAQPVAAPKPQQTIDIVGDQFASQRREYVDSGRSLDDCPF